MNTPTRNVDINQNIDIELDIPSNGTDHLELGIELDVPITENGSEKLRDSGNVSRTIDITINRKPLKLDNESDLPASDKSSRKIDTQLYIPDNGTNTSGNIDIEFELPFLGKSREIDNGMKPKLTENARNINIELDLPANEETSDQSDTDSEREKVIKEMAKVVGIKEIGHHGDDDLDDELCYMGHIRCDYEDKLSVAEIRDTYTATPKDNWGFTTRTIPELNLTWDSAMDITHGRTTDTSRSYYNQCPHNTASVSGSQPGTRRTKRKKKLDNINVRWSSRLGERFGGRKLFCYNQYEVMQMAKASQRTGDIDTPLSR